MLKTIVRPMSSIAVIVLLSITGCSTYSPHLNKRITPVLVKPAAARPVVHNTLVHKTLVREAVGGRNRVVIVYR